MQISVDYSVTESGKKAPQYGIDTDLDGEVSLQDFLLFLKQNLIVISDMALREEQASGFDKEPVILVDGREGKSVSNVSPFGQIEFVARASASDMLIRLYETLLKHSPVDTGLYLESHLVTVNGNVIAANLQELVSWMKNPPPLRPGTIIRFINVTPYGAKLEREGISQGRQRRKLGKSRDKKLRSGLQVRQPNGAYFLSLRSFKSRYRGNVKAFFEFINGGTLGIKPGVNAPLTSKRGKPLRYDFAPTVNGKKNKHRGPYIFPSIRIVVTEGGLV